MADRWFFYNNGECVMNQDGTRSMQVSAREIQDFLAGGGVIEAERRPALADLKIQMQGRLLENVNKFIEKKPDGLSRYDTNLKFNLMQAQFAAVAAGQAIPAPVQAVQSWTSAVQAHYFSLKSAIVAAADYAALDAVDISREGFEALFGLEGAQSPDPDIYTSDLAG